MDEIGETADNTGAASAPVNALLCPRSMVSELTREAEALPRWDLTFEQTGELELLASGAYSPLSGYIGQTDYQSICRNLRLADGTVWPMPVVLDVSRAFAERLSVGDRVALYHGEGMPLAIVHVSDIWEPDREADGFPPRLQQRNPIYLGGSITGLALPPHHTFQSLRFTPTALRARFVECGWDKIAVYQSCDVMHREQVQLAQRMAEQYSAHILLSPLVDENSPNDLGFVATMLCYEAALQQFPSGLAMLGLVPAVESRGTPHELLRQAIILKNYGCTHFIVTDDYEYSAINSDDGPPHNPAESIELARRFSGEIGLEFVIPEKSVYCHDLGDFIPRSAVPAGARIETLSNEDIRQRIRRNENIPEWTSYADVLAHLRHHDPPRSDQGFTILFTGLSGAGKSTIARILLSRLTAHRTRPVTLLDGDLVRLHLSSELGFSRKDRDLNIHRIGFVAEAITRSRGAAICAPIAPYRRARRAMREAIGRHGGFIEVYVSTPLAVCEHRDRKGLYARARAGLLKDFTGINDPYEPPERAEITVDTTDMSAADAAEQIIEYLQKEGYIGDR